MVINNNNNYHGFQGFVNQRFETEKEATEGGISRASGEFTETLDDVRVIYSDLNSDTFVCRSIEVGSVVVYYKKVIYL